MTSQNKQTIAVVGSSSMVGSRFCELSTGLTLIKTDIKGEIPLDITDNNSVESFFNSYKFDHLILFSAYTDVDKAESQRNNKNGRNWRINVGGAANICKFCKKFEKKLIYISTDFVFDGENGPYSEEAPFGPNMDKVSWYGVSKIEAEKLVQALPGFLILRISYPYRANYGAKTDFARSILQKFQEGNLYPMFKDQLITPTFADDLAPALSILIKKNQQGIFHLASPQVTTPVEFASYLIEKSGANPNEIREGSLQQFLEKGNTPRPLKGGLICKKIVNLGYIPTSWRDGIEELIRQSNQDAIA